MQTLTMSYYATMFREGNNIEDSNSTITFTSGMILYELDRARSKIEKVSY